MPEDRRCSRHRRENRFAKEAWLLSCGKTGTSTNKSILGYQSAVVVDETLKRNGFHFDRLGASATQAIYIRGENPPEAIVKVEIDFFMSSRIILEGARCGEAMFSETIGESAWLCDFFAQEGSGKWAETDHRIADFIARIDGELPLAQDEDVPPTGEAQEPSDEGEAVGENQVPNAGERQPAVGMSEDDDMPAVGVVPEMEESPVADEGSGTGEQEVPVSAPEEPAEPQEISGALPDGGDMPMECGQPAEDVRQVVADNREELIEEIVCEIVARAQKRFGEQMAAALEEAGAEEPPRAEEDVPDAGREATASPRGDVLDRLLDLVFSRDQAGS